MNKLKYIFLNFIKDNWLSLLICTLIFLLGFILGIATIGRMGEDSSRETLSYLTDFLEYLKLNSLNYSQISQGAIWSGVLTILIIYILGLTIIGIPLAFAIVFLRGFLLGFSFIFLVQTLSLKKIFLITALIFPHNLFYGIGLILGASICLTFGILLFKRNFDSTLPILSNWRRYSLIMLFALGITLLGAIIEVYISPTLIKMFVSGISF